MVSINIHNSLGAAKVRSNEKLNPQKSTLEQMKELYNNWAEFSILYFPATAATEGLEKSREALEKYIKDNNLNIEVKNLELFFNDVKNTAKNMSSIGANNAILQMLQNYIDNGYNPEFSMRKNVENAFKEPKGPSEEELSEIKSIIISNIVNDFNTFRM